MTGIDPHIFRAYDIRGRADEQLTEDACRQIGQAFGTELRSRYELESPRVVVGRDARTHGARLEAAVVEGLKAAGCHVLRIGQTPSPVNYFTICARDLDGGVQVTASHNPAHDNGLKLQGRQAEAFAGQDLQDLRERIERKDVTTGEGAEEEIDAIAPYLEHLTRLFPDAGKGLQVVVDGGNGVAGPAYCEALRRVGCTVTELYTEPDGTFPNHAADPSKHETLKELQTRVTSEKAALGFGFDGDGDRLGLVDETGTICTADEILLILSRGRTNQLPSEAAGLGGA